jgi:hypothetical protein
MAQLVYSIHSSGMGKVVNVLFCLAIGLVVLEGAYHDLELNVLQKVLPEGVGELAVSIRDDREMVFLNTQHLIEEPIGCRSCINILENRREVCIPTEAIKDNKIEVILLVSW